MASRSATPLGRMIRHIVWAYLTGIVKWQDGLLGAQRAARPAVVSIVEAPEPGPPATAAVTDSGRQDLSSAATPVTTAFSAAITMAKQPVSKAIMGFQAWVAPAAGALAEEAFTAVGGGGND